MINFALIDHELTPEEEIYIRKVITQYPFNSQEKEMFDLEFESPGLDFKTIFASIKSYETREVTIQKLRGIHSSNNLEGELERVKFKQLQDLQQVISKDSKEIAIQKLRLQTLLEKETSQSKDLEAISKTLTKKKYGIVFIFYPILFLGLSLFDLSKLSKRSKKIVIIIIAIFFALIILAKCSRYS